MYMKKIFLVLLLLLCSCSKRSDFYKLSIDDYSITVGYDTASFLDIAYDFELKDSFEENEEIEGVEIRLFGDLLGTGSFVNLKGKRISSDKALLKKLTVYLKDLDGRTFKINDEELDSSVKNNCDHYNGTYIEKNGYACLIENPKGNGNYIELHGDYLNIDQDELDHIIIFVK